MGVGTNPILNNPSSDTAFLNVVNVQVNYGHVTVLDAINFQIGQGGQVAVIGPNGAGKSTLFKAMLGLVPMARGQVFIHNQPLGGHLDCVAYVPQREEIDWKFPLTVADAVMMGRYGRHRGLRQPGKDDQRIVLESLDQLGLLPLAKRPISDLSGGQQQRVFIARALAQEPHVLLMDEPFAGVDVSTQEATLQLLGELRKRNVTVLVSTHDLEMASKRFEQALLLNGRMIAFGAPEMVFTHNHLMEAFSGKVLTVSGAYVVDECCPVEKQVFTREI